MLLLCFDLKVQVRQKTRPILLASLARYCPEVSFLVRHWFHISCQWRFPAAVQTGHPRYISSKHGKSARYYLTGSSLLQPRSRLSSCSFDVFSLLLLLTHALGKDQSPLLPAAMAYITHFSPLLDSKIIIKQRAVCSLRTHCVISPLIQKNWGIKLIRVWTRDAWWRSFCSVLLYRLLQQRMSCWLYGDAVVSAGVRMCGYFRWCIRHV